VPPLAKEAVVGLDVARLCEPPAPGANTIAWLVWHTARVQDHHISELLDSEQLWVTSGWAKRFGLEPDPDNTGYGHTPDEVVAVRPESPQALLDYLDATHQRATGFVGTVDAAALDRIVDRRWDPPVTLGVRLVSVADDSLQHVGQAAYVRGLFRV
jgi:hypothetical protein